MPVNFSPKEEEGLGLHTNQWPEGVNGRMRDVKNYEADGRDTGGEANSSGIIVGPRVEKKRTT